jgi:eukaryotic-like serine/threonine-protein kinase
VKVLTRSGEHGSIDALRDEAQRACRVRHPNAVRILDFGLLPPRSAFLVMELLEGPTLDVALKRAGQLRVDVAVSHVRGVLGALAMMHKQGLVHRDVKPANVLLHRERDAEVPKLLDFGTARALDDPDDEPEGIVGSIAYVCPERLSGAGYDGKADVYSCGVMLYKLLTGELPMEELRDPDSIAKWHLEATPPAPSQQLPGLSREVDALVLKLMAKKARERPSADEAESLIETVLWG